MTDTQQHEPGEWPDIQGLIRAGLDLARSLGWYLASLYKASASTRLNPLRLVVEQVTLYWKHGIDTHTYFTYRLFDPHLSWADKLTYLPTDHSRGLQAMLALLTPSKYWSLYRNKLTFSLVFNPLPLPPIYAVFNPHASGLAQVEAVADEPARRIISAWKKFVNPLQVDSLNDVSELDRWMRTTSTVEVAYKPIYGSHGRNILVFSGRAPDDPGTFVTLAGERYDAKRLAAFSGNVPMLFQQRVKQHPKITALLGETLCCVRVVTFVGLDGKAQILGAVFKVQASPLGVDHLIYGAVGSWVDMDTGRLNKGRTRFSLESTWQIPGTDRSFEGFHLPCWDSVKSMALLAAESIPEARSVGWDIAISEAGPVFIEGNDFWSVELIQMPAPHGLIRGEFKALVDEVKRLDAQEKAKRAATTPP